MVRSWAIGAKLQQLTLAPWLVELLTSLGATDCHCGDEGLQPPPPPQPPGYVCAPAHACTYVYTHKYHVKPCLFIGWHVQIYSKLAFERLWLSPSDLIYTFMCASDTEGITSQNIYTCFILCILFLSLSNAMVVDENLPCPTNLSDANGKCNHSTAEVIIQGCIEWSQL